MLSRSNTSNKKSSNWIILLFFITILILGAGTELFQSPTSIDENLQKFQTVLQTNEISDLTDIQIENKLGLFRVQSLKTKENQKWVLSFPRNLPIKQDKIHKVIDSIKNLNIKNILPLDTINKSNFSLSSPRYTIKFKRLMDQEWTSLYFGLVNPIDNSTYLTLSNKDIIYHVDSINFPLDSLKFTQLIETLIIPLRLSKIQKVAIYKGAQTNVKPRLFFQRFEKTWSNQKNVQLNEKKVTTFLNQLLNIKSLIIVDEKSLALEEKMKEMLKRPSYTLEITDINNNSFTYLFSGQINKLPGIKLSQGKSILVSSSTQTHPYVMKKENLALFLKKQKYFKKLSIKKLFY